MRREAKARSSICRSIDSPRVPPIRRREGQAGMAACHDADGARSHTGGHLMLFTRCTCHIVPSHVLKRLSQDKTLPEEQRKKFADTMKIDAELRKLRIQAAKLTRVAKSLAPTAAAA